MHEMDCTFGSGGTVGDVIVDTVVIDDTVLEHLDYRSALVACSRSHYLLGYGKLNVKASGKEVATRPEHEFCRDKRVLYSAVR